jgi:hypothetical protein
VVVINREEHAPIADPQAPGLLKALELADVSGG